MENCIFCGIANGDSSIWLWSNEVAVAIKDLHPKAPVHVLVLPKQHIRNLDELEDEILAGKLLMAVRQAAETAGVKGAWKLKVNNGSGAGQSVDHLHFHILGGVQMAE